MKHNSLRQSSYAVLAALIWGTAFVAQSMAAGAVPSFAFNASRAVIAFAFLLVLCVVLQAVRRRQGKPVSTTRSKKDLLLGGLCCGVAMGLATYLQQKGLETTTSGKASFITTLYIVLIPIAGLFMKKRVPRTIWLSVALAVVGLYCLCVTESRRSLRAAVRLCVHGTDSLCGSLCKICGRSGALLRPVFLYDHFFAGRDAAL